jgi:hypothetical protein
MARYLYDQVAAAVLSDDHSVLRAHRRTAEALRGEYDAALAPGLMRELVLWIDLALDRSPMAAHYGDSIPADFPELSL